MDLPFRGGLSTWSGGKGGLRHQVRDRAWTGVLKDRELGERIIKCYHPQEDSKPNLLIGCLFFAQCPAHNKGFADGDYGWPQAWCPARPHRQSPQMPMSLESRAVLE